MPESLHISSSSVSPVAGSELTNPIDEALSSIFGIEVKAKRWEFEPPAAGLSEIAYTAMIVGGVGLLYKFFEPLVTVAGEGFRDRLLELIGKGTKSKNSERHYIPARIVLGEGPEAPVRYYFHGHPSPQELLIRLEAADAHIKSIPPEMFVGSGGPSENGFFWDDETRAWRGTVWRYPEPPFGVFWLPPNLWVEEEDNGDGKN